MSSLNQKKKESALLRNYCLISGILACIVMLIFYFFHDNTLLFGDATVLRMDLYHQYGPLYAELYDRITGGKSLVYSWTSGLGNSFIGNMLNYLASPFAVVMLIFGHENMPEAIAVMMLLKAVLASVTFTYFVNKSTRTVRPASIAFGLLYAFCGYFVAYSWNIMWMDAVSVFPLVMLGIERIINEKRPALYIVMLTYTMYTNYYMAYMVCILSVLYYLFYYFSNYPLTDRFKADGNIKKKKKTEEPAPRYAEGLVVKEETAPENDLQTENLPPDQTGNPLITDEAQADAYTEQLSQEEIAPPTTETEQHTAENTQAEPVAEKKGRHRLPVSGLIFGFSSVLSFMLAAAVLIPLYFCLKACSATTGTFPAQMQNYFKIFDFLANHLASLEPTIRSSGDNVLPNIYSGVISILLLPAFFMSKRIASRKKVMAMFLLGIFFLSFNVNQLNYIWHGFHFPNDLPYRFSFAYSFILLYLGYQVLLNISEFSRKYFVATGFIALLFIVFVEKLGSKNVDNNTLVISVVFILIYVILAGLISSQSFTKKNLEYLLIFFVIVEIACADTSHLVMSQPKANYTSDYAAYTELAESVESKDDDLFYRTELSRLRTRMDPCWYGYNGVSVFSSMAYEKTSNMMNSLGLFGNNINSYTYYPQTAVFNAFFSLKYVYDNDNHLVTAGSTYTKLRDNGTFTAYKNKYYLPLAFSVNRDVAEWDPSANSNPFTVQNDLVRLSTGYDGVLERVDVTNVECTNCDYITPSVVNSGTMFSVNKTDASQNATVRVIIDVAASGRYYVYAGSMRASSLKFTGGSDISYNYVSSGIQPFVLDMGDRKVGDQVIVEYTMDSSNTSGMFTFCAARLNQPLFDSAYNGIISNGTLKLTSFEETALSGTIRVANDDSFIYTSIPYDQSWQIYVDGERLQYAKEDAEAQDNEIIRVGKGLLGFGIGKGEHTVSFKYVPQGLGYGLVLTAIGAPIAAVILGIQLLLYIRKKNDEPAVANTETE